MITFDCEKCGLEWNLPFWAVLLDILLFIFTSAKCPQCENLRPV